MDKQEPTPRHSAQPLRILGRRVAVAITLTLIAGLSTSCPSRRAAAPGTAGTPATPPPAAGVPASGASARSYLVTVTPLKLILDPLVGDRASVTVLLAPGASAHTYEPRPSDAMRAESSAALFWVGESFDGWAAMLSAPQKVALLELLPAAERLPGVEHHHHGEAEHGEPAHADSGAPGAENQGAAGGQGAGGGKTVSLEETDPHVFTDPLTLRALLPGLTAELSRLDPDGAEQYKLNAAKFAVELDSLGGEVAKELAGVKGRSALTYHQSFGYLFHRYGIVVAGMIEEFPGKEPSPRDLAHLVDVAREQHVAALFTETLMPRRPAEVIAEATHLPLFELDPACGASTRRYASYRDYVLYNVGVIAKALGQPDHP